MNTSRIRIVLVRTYSGQNLGAVARAMKNFGFTRLVLADLGPVNWDEVQTCAVQSFEVAEQAPRVSSLQAALEGCAWAVGTTMRTRPGQRSLTPEAVAERAWSRAENNDVALVFGEARSGLTNQDLLHCHDTSIIPTDDRLRSLNLAQAVLVYVRALFEHRAQPGLSPEGPRAVEADYDRIQTALTAHLTDHGFQDLDRPNNGVRDLMQTLKRAGLTPHEARLWEAVFRRRRPR